MFKKITTIIAILWIIPTIVFAADTYIVQKNDSLWKIAVKYQIGVSEIIQANPQFKNPNLIYPGDKVYVPNIDELKAIEREVIHLTNVKRQQNGLPPLYENWELSRCARYKSNDMAAKGYFSHQSPTYGSPFDMMKHFGISYRSAGENIAKGQQTAAAVVESWYNSPGHRANMLSRSFNQIGVGYNATQKVWTQMFIQK
ncbi:MAG: safA [Bacillales bacterium]|jgi:uncharacterized YkwD family protein/spore coat assembly protein SafA|nr:safA [Bacillales bacterium]